VRRRDRGDPAPGAGAVKTSQKREGREAKCLRDLRALLWTVQGVRARTMAGDPPLSLRLTSAAPYTASQHSPSLLTTCTVTGGVIGNVGRRRYTPPALT